MKNKNSIDPKVNVGAGASLARIQNVQSTELGKWTLPAYSCLKDAIDAGLKVGDAYNPLIPVACTGEKQDCEEIIVSNPNSNCEPPTPRGFMRVPKVFVIEENGFQYGKLLSQADYLLSLSQSQETRQKNLEAREDALNTQRDTLTAQVKQATSELDQARDEAKSIEDDLQSAQDELATLTKQLASVQAQFNEECSEPLSEQCQSLQKEITELQSQIREVNAQIAELTDRLARAQADVDAKQKTRDALAAQLDAVQAELDAVRSAAKAADGAIQDARDASEEAATQASNLRECVLQNAENWVSSLPNGFITVASYLGDLQLYFIPCDLAKGFGPGEGVA